MTSVTSYIGKCIDDVTISKTITTRSNEKPWMTAKVRALLKSRDSAFRAGDKVALKTASAKLSQAIRGEASTHPENLQPLSGQQRLLEYVAGHTGDHKLQDHTICL
ncbi:hypothetical protein QTP86_000240 [Hemibagrus guttatus]|nr:hypothetical protein QTP86_000240 [Hemibagrus guttatus]